MASLEKPRSITIIVTDRKAKKSKSFVVYSTTVDDVTRQIKAALKK